MKVPTTALALLIAAQFGLCAAAAKAEVLPPIPDLFISGEQATPASPELEESRRFREEQEASFQAALPGLVRHLQAGVSAVRWTLFAS